MAPRNLEGSTLDQEGHVSILILSQPAVLGLTAKANAETVRGKMPIDPFKEHPLNNLRKDVADYLDPFRLLTTVVHVVLPEFQEINLSIKVAGRTGVNTVQLLKDVEKRLRDFVDPYTGGENGKGWPFGQAVRLFELYQKIEAIESVDHVENLFLGDNPQANEITLQPNQLPCLKTIKVEST